MFTCGDERKKSTKIFLKFTKITEIYLPPKHRGITRALFGSETHFTFNSDGSASIPNSVQLVFYMKVCNHAHCVGLPDGTRLTKNHCWGLKTTFSNNLFAWANTLGRIRNAHIEHLPKIVTANIYIRPSGNLRLINFLAGPSCCNTDKQVSSSSHPALMPRHPEV